MEHEGKECLEPAQECKKLPENKLLGYTSGIENKLFFDLPNGNNMTTLAQSEAVSRKLIEEKTKRNRSFNQMTFERKFNPQNQSFVIVPQAENCTVVKINGIKL